MRGRNHILLLTGLLTVVSLGLVFGAVLQYLPVASLPYPPDTVLHAIPHLNAILSIAGIIAISLGWYWIRHGDIQSHRTAMLTAMTVFLCFLALYLYRVALLGPTSFPGPAPIYRFVYLPVLGIHVFLAVLCLPLLYYVLLIGLTFPIVEIPHTRHQRVGRIVTPLWITSFALGIIVYLFLYVMY